MAAATQTQLRRGTSSQCDSMTPAEAEIVIDLTNDRIRIGDGLTAGGIPCPNYNDIQKQAFAYAPATLASGVITITPTNPLSGYGEGVSFEFKADANNPGATNINISSLGEVDLLKDINGSLVELDADDIVAGIIYRVTHNGSAFQLMNINTSSPVTVGMVYLGRVTATSGNKLTVGSSFINSTYDNYKLIAHQLSGASAPIPQYALSTDGGTTNAGPGQVIGPAASGGNQGQAAEINIYGVNSSINPKRSTHMAPLASGVVGGFSWATAAAINGVNFLASGGTFSNIVVDVYGYAK